MPAKDNAHSDGQHGQNSMDLENPSENNSNSMSSNVPNGIHREKGLSRSLIELGILDENDVKLIDDYQKSHGASFEKAAKVIHKLNKDDLAAANAQYYHYPILSKNDRSLYSKELVTAFLPHSPQAELFRSLRSRILLNANITGNSSEKCAFAVISPDSKDGRSYIAANLAIVFGQLGKTTILLDMDMRSPRQHKIFNISNEVGISDVFAQNSSAPNWQQLPFISNLVIVPAGPVPPNPQELLCQSSFELVLNILYDVFDYVIIDTPASTSSADAEIIASRIQSALVVSRKHNTNLESLESLISRLKSNHVNLLGSVYNNT